MRPTAEDRKLVEKMQSLAQQQLDKEINTINKQMQKGNDLLIIALKTFTALAIIIIAIYSFIAIK